MAPETKKVVLEFEKPFAALDEDVEGLRARAAEGEPMRASAFGIARRTQMFSWLSARKWVNDGMIGSPQATSAFRASCFTRRCRISEIRIGP